VSESEIETIFERMKATGECRVIEVSPEFKAELTGFLQPDERWVKVLPDGRSAVLLWTMASGHRQLLFVVKKNEI
jgi:hypothetical protein